MEAEAPVVWLAIRSARRVLPEDVGWAVFANENADAQTDLCTSTNVCVPECDQGEYVNSSIPVTSCAKCPFGQYGDRVGMDKCKNCPAGGWSDQLGVRYESK